MGEFCKGFWWMQTECFYWLWPWADRAQVCVNISIYWWSVQSHNGCSHPTESCPASCFRQIYWSALTVEIPGFASLGINECWTFVNTLASGKAPTFYLLPWLLNYEAVQINSWTLSGLLWISVWTLSLWSMGQMDFMFDWTCDRYITLSRATVLSTYNWASVFMVFN